MTTFNRRITEKITSQLDEHWSKLCINWVGRSGDRELNTVFITSAEYKSPVTHKFANFHFFREVDYDLDDVLDSPIILSLTFYII